MAKNTQKKQHVTEEVVGVKSSATKELDSSDSLKKLFYAIRFEPRISMPLRRSLIDMVRGAAERTHFGEVFSMAEKRVSDSLLAVAEFQFEAAEKIGAAVVSIFDEEYPVALREIDTAPLLLFVRGAPLTAAATRVAIVGSRKASRYGLSCAHEFGEALSEAGVAVVSGLALGIDAAAHRGAIDGAARNAGNPGIAVLGSGVANLTPAANRELGEMLLEFGGSIDSEYGITTDAQSHHFPERNRIVTGLSRAVVVVEAATRSGALISARLGLEQNKDVFAVPGQINSSKSQGTNALIQDGARPLLSTTDLCKSLNITPVKLSDNPPKTPTTTKEANKHSDKLDAGIAKQVLHVLDHRGICQFDELVQEIGCSTAELNAALADLELRNRLVVLPGQYYQLG